MYIGPRPPCIQARADGPLLPAGRVVLTLFAYDNPPPPSGGATSALDLLVVPGHELFASSDDCMPASPGPDDLRVFITRSASFTWPGILLGADYQIRGFYDTDADFVPFFSVRRGVTAGDVIGGALKDPASGSAELSRLTLPAASKAPKGARLKGLVVTLMAPVNTEPPLFRLGDTAIALLAEARLPMTSEIGALESGLWAQTETRLELVDTTTGSYAAALDAAGMAFNPSPLNYAWYVRDVDANGDGSVDLHPVLGSLAVTWQTPILILRRAQTPAEQRAGLPQVSLVGSVRPTQVAAKKVFHPAIDMLIPPIAVVDLIPGDPSCRVPYVPPLNLSTVYEAVPTECQELPSGYYSLSVLHGVAGAVPQVDVPQTVSDTTFDLAGSRFSGQAWTIPNEFGPADSAYNPASVDQLDPGLLIDEQGPNGRYLVYDATVDNGVRHDCSVAPDATLGGQRREVNYIPVPDKCCAAVAKVWCKKPLCDATEVEEGRFVRGATAESTDDSLPCTPFLMPASCCL